jgi:hypothetical protein
MITCLTHTAATARHDATRPTGRKKNHRGFLTASMLLTVGWTTLWSINAVGNTELSAGAPSVQLAGAVTSMEGTDEPHVQALSGPPIPLEPASTVSQRNAVRTAKDYLDYTAFSRTGLVRQLEYEGFSTDDATFAVDHIAVDWNEQAAKAAKDYLDYSGFSRSGLIDQLEYEGFTPAQAAYGVTAAGL